ncbi:MAG TPA: hypothetical protein VFU19_08460 [Iamia sp.]|nr:hypothetical protein [Iamia sp.]
MTATAEERRRGIALVMETRPEIDLDELQRLLARAGVEVDVDTLVDDLEALGYEVDDEVTPGPVPPTIDPVDDGSYDDDGDEEPAGGAGRWAVLGLAAVVVVVALVALVVGLGRDDDEPALEEAPPGTEMLEDGAADTTTEPPRVAPEGPGRDPALEVPEALTDDFERAGIGDFPGVSTWELLSGEWANTDGNLDLVALSDEGVAVAAVDPGSGDVRAEVQVDRPGTRAGLAFRIADEDDFLLWAPMPEEGTIILFEVVEGEATPLVDSGITAPDDGMPALGVNLVGERAELLRDGAVVATYDGVAPAEEGTTTRIGVGALRDGEGLPLFDELRVLVP